MYLLPGAEKILAAGKTLLQGIVQADAGYIFAVDPQHPNTRNLCPPPPRLHSIFIPNLPFGPVALHNGDDFVIKAANGLLVRPDDTPCLHFAAR